MAWGFNPFTGTLDKTGSGGAENFSYENVISTKTLLIPVNQQMIVSGVLTVDGTITLNGAIVLIN
jgi:hypothetical protein